MNNIENIIIHCSDSGFGNASVVREWHLEKGWRDIGYNCLILNGYPESTRKYMPTHDGKIEMGRGLDFSDRIEPDEVGAHALGYNKNSIGICLIGKDKFTIPQLISLYAICRVFTGINPNISIMGHYETKNARGKTCPNIEMNKLRTFLYGYSVTESHIKSKLQNNIMDVML